MRITDEQLAALRAANPRGVIVLKATPEEGGESRDFAFRKIDRATFAKHRAAQKAALAAGGGTGEEEMAVARELLLWPEKAVFDALREDAPGVCHTFGLELLSDAAAGLVVDRDPR